MRSNTYVELRVGKEHIQSIFAIFASIYVPVEKRSSFFFYSSALNVQKGREEKKRQKKPEPALLSPIEKRRSRHTRL